MDVSTSRSPYLRYMPTPVCERALQLSVFFLLLTSLLTACVTDRSDAGGDDLPDASTDWSRDILHTSLNIDLETMTGIADLVLSGSLLSSAASFEIGDLTIINVVSDGDQLKFNAKLGQLDVGIPLSVGPQTITIEYYLNLHDNFDGILDSGVTFTWPYYCGNIFPCKSQPAEGSGFELVVSGIPDGDISIYPELITADAPSYMLAWAVGDYDYSMLGITANGTEVGVYYFPDEAEKALNGTRYLRDVFDWYEQTYGDYLFGEKVASVSVKWPAGGFGGLEHHPFWHIAGESLNDPVVHAHEASHGWFGNGVRIGCWEDFVLSEGIASYLAARALNEVAGEEYGNQIWQSYENRLDLLQNSNENKIAWPEGCNEIDILEDGLYGAAPYMKGAFFFKHLEYKLGKEVLDRLLRNFFSVNSGHAVNMQMLITAIKEGSTYDPTACAQAWLRMESIVDTDACIY
ncbi:MAG: peptidase M1 [Candidatus Thiodiazotropha sp. (ex Codakia orbicularis)]|nr:peptidase M1 [Candidatus Thiodiazotropha sp. (ex Codakia orbicularis)]